MHPLLVGIWFYFSNVKVSICQKHYNKYKMIFPEHEENYFRIIGKEGRVLLSIKNAKGKTNNSGNSTGNAKGQDIHVINGIFLLHFCVAYPRQTKSFYNTNFFSILYSLKESRKYKIGINPGIGLAHNNQNFWENIFSLELEEMKIIRKPGIRSLTDSLNKTTPTLDSVVDQFQNFFQNNDISHKERQIILISLIKLNPLEKCSKILELIENKRKLKESKLNLSIWNIYNNYEVSKCIYIRKFYQISYDVITAIRSVTKNFASENIMSQYEKFILHNILHHSNKKVNLQGEELDGGFTFLNLKKIVKLMICSISIPDKIVQIKGSYKAFFHTHYDGKFHFFFNNSIIFF